MDSGLATTLAALSVLVNTNAAYEDAGQDGFVLQDSDLAQEAIKQQAESKPTAQGVHLLTPTELEAVKSVPIGFMKRVRGDTAGADTFCKLLSKQGLAHGCNPKDPFVYATYLKNLDWNDEMGTSALADVFSEFATSSDKFLKASTSITKTDKQRYESYLAQGSIFSGCLTSSDGELQEIIRANGIPRDMLNMAKSRGELCRLVDGYLKSKKATGPESQQFWTEGGAIPMIKSAPSKRPHVQRYRKMFSTADKGDVVGKLMKADPMDPVVNILQELENEQAEAAEDRTTSAGYYSGYLIPNENNSPWMGSRSRSRSKRRSRSRSRSRRRRH